MLKNIYTTHMSGKGKLLQTRFETINTIPKRLSKLITFISIVVLTLSFMVTSYFAASLIEPKTDKAEDFMIQITNNGEPIQLENKLFIKDGVLYVPLREFFTSFGMMESGAYITMDDGKILMQLHDKNTMPDAFMTHTGYMYKIEIGKNEIVVNPEELSPQAKELDAVFVEEMSASPVLHNGITYVPYEYIFRIVERADRGVLSYPDKYNLDIVFNGEVFSVKYPFKNYQSMGNGFGKRVHPITGEVNFHNGMDIRVGSGTEIMAGFNGTVSDCGYDENDGNYIKIKNSIGVEILYAHLSDVLVSKHDAVKRGEIIGLSGNSGKSTGAHLHIELKIDDKYVNPKIYFEQTDELRLVSAVERTVLLKLERLNLSDYGYIIKDVFINDNNDKATVIIELTKPNDTKTLTMQYEKVADIWNWKDAVVK